MTDDAADAAKRPKGSPQLIILLVVILAPTLLIGQLLGAGGAAVIGGFIALFSLISSMGGSLRANLRRFAFVGPLIAFGAVVPRLLAEVSIPAAIALATLGVLVAGMLPLRSRRYDGTALGFGMGTLLGYSIPIGVTTPAQLVAAAGSGLIVAVAMLVLTGFRDPSGPTRSAVAGLLEDEDRDFAAAFDAWTADSSPRWLGSVLLSAGRYRMARRVLSRAPELDAGIVGELNRAAERATAIAESVRLKTADGGLPSGAEVAPDMPAGSTLASQEMFGALDEAQRAAAERDPARQDVPASLRTGISGRAVRAAFGRGSLQLRHAIRTAVAVLLAFLVSLFLKAGDPLLPTLLMTTFGLVQISWHATITRARDRLIGIVAGGALVVLVLAYLPAPFLFPISMVGLAVGMWFITARPAIGAAGMIVMSVGLNTELRHLDPLVVVIEYVVLAAIAVLIGSILGFVIVPAWRPPALRARVAEAVQQTSLALDALAGDSPTGSGDLHPQAVADAQAATQQLVPENEKLTNEQEQELERFRNDLQDLLITAIFLAYAAGNAAAPTLQEAASALTTDRPGSGTTAAHDTSAETVLLLTEEVIDRRHRVEAMLP